MTFEPRAHAQKIGCVCPRLKTPPCALLRSVLAIVRIIYDHATSVVFFAYAQKSFEARAHAQKI